MGDVNDTAGNLTWNWTLAAPLPASDLQLDDFNGTAGNMTWNWTLAASLPAGDLQLDAIWYFLASCILLSVLVAWVSNAIVLKALDALDDEKMKVKFLLKNSIVGDLLLTISIACRTVFFMTGFWENPEYGDLSSCTNLVYGFYAYFSAFYQIFATMTVAFDRFYSILSPLKYHTMVYTKKAKVVVVSLVLVVSLALSLPTMLLKFGPGKSLSEVCKASYQRSTYASMFLPYVIVLSVFTTLLTYCLMFLLIAYHRAASRHTLGERVGDQNILKKQISLAVTFFMIHITYVIMYIPGALYLSYLGSAVAAYHPYLDLYLSQLTVLIYLLNAVADPLIYIFRIKSIRASVNLLFGKKTPKAIETATSVYSQS